jgi:hypothetical protein
MDGASSGGVAVFPSHVAEIILPVVAPNEDGESRVALVVGIEINIPLSWLLVPRRKKNAKRAVSRRTQVYKFGRKAQVFTVQ